jgi:hypothetical protein
LTWSPDSKRLFTPITKHPSSDVLNLPASTEAFHLSFICPEKPQQIFNPINWLSKIKQEIMRKSAVRITIATIMSLPVYHKQHNLLRYCKNKKHEMGLNAKNNPPPSSLVAKKQ